MRSASASVRSSSSSPTPTRVHARPARQGSSTWRPELGRALLRIAATGAPLVGASDHLVSEALYVSDPEGNGIEIYRDRPRSEWSRDGEEIAMATLPLDLRDVAATTGEQAPERGMDDAARIGHVHLNVADLDEAERFYGQVLGFDVTARGYPGALFLAAGGYHHHVGLNVWAGKGAPPPPAGAAGLRAFEIELADGAELEAATERLREAGVAFELEHGILTTEDPSRNRIVLRARR